MKTKEEIRAWILENCVDDFGDINLSRLNFSGKTVITTEMVADKIFQNCHKAKEITQGHHNATTINNIKQKASIIDNSDQEAGSIENNNQFAQSIDNSFQRAEEIRNQNQTLLPRPRKVVEFELNEEERVKLNKFLKEMRK